MGLRVVSAYWLLHTALLRTLLYTCLSDLLIPILLGVYSGVDLLGHVAVPCLTPERPPGCRPQRLRQVTPPAAVFRSSKAPVFSPTLVTFCFYFIFKN